MDQLQVRFFFNLLLVVALMDSQISYVTAQSTTQIPFTELKVNGTQVWVILASAGGAVGVLILILLIAVCCAFRKKGSKVGTSGYESGSYEIDPVRFPSAHIQTDYHPGFARLVARLDRATMTKRSMWSGITPVEDDANSAWVNRDRKPRTDAYTGEGNYNYQQAGQYGEQAVHSTEAAVRY